MSDGELSRSDLYDIPWADLFVEAVKRRPTAFGFRDDVEEGDIRVELAKLFPQWRNCKDEIAGALADYLEAEGVIDAPTHRDRRDEWRWA